MKAAVCYGERKLSIENIPDPTLEPGGIIVKVRACAICGSNLHLYNEPIVVLIKP